MAQRLAWYRWEYPDPIHKNLWTAYTVSVYPPTYDRPYVSILVSIANGGGKVLMRAATVKEAQRRTGMPDEAMERLQLAETRAITLLSDIRRDLQVIADVKSLSPGASLVRTDTGQVIAEVEQLLKESR